MRAVVLTEVGEPKVLVAQNVPTPVPGAGQVLVRTEAVGVHFAETLLRSGVYPLPAPLPAVFGTQAVGVVTEVGPDADPDLIGTRVAVSAMTGCYAENVVVEAFSITPVPDGPSAVEAVAVVMQGSVALALMEAAGVTDSDTVLVEAAATGVGAYLTQLLRRAGVRRILGTAGRSKHAQARDLGVDQLIDSAAPTWHDQLDDASVDVVFESIGGDSAAAVLPKLIPLRGRMIHYGMLSGAPAAVTPMDLMTRGVTLTGCGGLAFHARLAETRRRALELVAAGELTPMIDTVLPLDGAPEAHRRIEAREHRGMVVLTP
ncbi:quinone oxidoreductase family protein [Nocardia takedensis]